jgi:hypothetical protein
VVDRNFEQVNDTHINTKDAENNTAEDFGRDLAGDKGVDLNDGDVSANKTSHKWRETIALGLLPFTPGLIDHGAIRDHVNSQPSVGQSQLYEKPETTDETSPFTFEGRERMIEEGAGPANEDQFEQYPEPEYGDHTDPPVDAPNFDSVPDADFSPELDF